MKTTTLKLTATDNRYKIVLKLIDNQTGELFTIYPNSAKHQIAIVKEFEADDYTCYPNAQAMRRMTSAESKGINYAR